MKETKVRVEGDKAVLNIDKPYIMPDLELCWSEVLNGTAFAFNCYRQQTPFVVSLSVESMFEMLFKESRRVKGDFTVGVVDGLFASLSPEECSARIDDFGARCELDDD